MVRSKQEQGIIKAYQRTQVQYSRSTNLMKGIQQGLSTKWIVTNIINLTQVESRCTSCKRDSIWVIDEHI